MGKEKCGLILGNRPLISHVLDRLAPIFERTVISGSNEALPRGLDYEVIPDRISGAGPLGGFCSAMESCPSDLYFLCGCDMPFVQPDLVRTLASLCSGYDAVVPVHDGRVHPVHAFYDRACLGAARELIDAKRYKMKDFLESIRTRLVTEEELAGFDAARSLFNINTPEDLAEAEEILSTAPDR